MAPRIEESRSVVLTALARTYSPLNDEARLSSMDVADRGLVGVC